MEPTTQLPQQQKPDTQPVSRALFKTFMIVCIVLFTLCILFLVYQNGKSIYDNGL